MSDVQPSRQPTASRLTTAALVAGSVAFGMVVASNLDMPRTAHAADTFAADGAATLAVATALPSFADLAEKVSPAVVSIRAVAFQTGPQRNQGNPFEFFFGPQGRGRGGDPEAERRAESGGSGFLVSADGYVVTNNHVVEGADQLEVLLGEETYPATVKGVDPSTDLALLKIEPKRAAPYLALGDSEALRVGDWVMAIGSPLRLDASVTVGVVSAKGRVLDLTDRALEDFIQTDAAINFGNSGGPLVNLRGEVVGINTAINFGAENIGFAVPVDTLKEVLAQLRDEGRVRRGFLGVDIDDLDENSAAAFGLDSTEGALVQRVTEGSPADKADLQHGDVIVSVEDKRIVVSRDLVNQVSRKAPGDKVEIELIRDGKKLKKTIELGERPGLGGEVAATEESVDGGVEWLGLRYQNLDPALRRLHGIPEEASGVWVAGIDARSPMVDQRIRPGDLIVEVNGEAVATPAELEAAVSRPASGSVLRFYVQRFDPRSGQSVGFFAFVRKP